MSEIISQNSLMIPGRANKMDPIVTPVLACSIHECCEQRVERAKVVERAIMNKSCNEVVVSFECSRTCPALSSAQRKKRWHLSSI